jgi:mycofactocin precursor
MPILCRQVQPSPAVRTTPARNLEEIQMNEFTTARTAFEAEDVAATASVQTVESPVEADDLIEEVSIDGMCGVY